MKEIDEVFEIDADNIEMDLMDIKETARIKNIITKLKLFRNNPEELKEIYTNMLEDENVAFIITRISQDPIFEAHFPEFYVKNSYDENVINCQQSSSYHKFGVFKHILATVEAVGNPQIPIGDWEKKLLKWTMLLHDIGKPYVKVISSDGSESFAGHDDKSVELAEGILKRFEFSADEMKIILTLIKYHDKFLNEGEITYDNMRFLVNELNNSKELFYLLIDVKDSDARAKSLEVYNKYKVTKNKYLEFINSYFAYNENSESEDNNSDVGTLSKSELDNLISSVVSRNKINIVYQPIVDLEKKGIFGHEVFTRLETTKKISIVDFLNYAKTMDKYDKVQQILLVNSIEAFEKNKTKTSKTLFVNSDFVSYNNYINKPRIYDMMAKNKIVIEFHNYEKKDMSIMKEVIDNIHKNNGFVALDNFGIGTLTIDDIAMLNVDYIIPDISLIQNIVEDENKQNFLSELITYSLSRNSHVIVVGIEDINTLNMVRKLGVNYVQGYFLEKPKESLSFIDEILHKLEVPDSEKEII